jgi:RND superfamily putative drug exporter
VAEDVHSMMQRRLPIVVGSVVATTLVVLLLAFGAIPVAVKAVVMNALSLAASFGVLVWVFQDGRFESLLAYSSVGSIDPLVPVLMFAIVFGLSMDYELFLLSRIREEYVRTGVAAGSVARGLEQTAGIITSAALLLIIVMGGFAAGRILFMRELGVGMVLAVAIDATIVRALLVPATMALLGRFNWWAPARFKAWWERSGIGVDERMVATAGDPPPPGGAGEPGRSDLGTVAP